MTHPELDDRFSTEVKRDLLKKKFIIPEMKAINVKCLKCGNVRGVFKQSWDNGFVDYTTHDKLMTCPICKILTSHVIVEKVGEPDE